MSCAEGVCGGWTQVRSRLPPGVDGWGYSLKGMMGMVVIGGLLITATYWLLQRTVVPRVQAGQPKKKKNKPNMSVGESFTFLAKSPYIRDLALLVSFRHRFGGAFRNYLLAEQIARWLQLPVKSCCAKAIRLRKSLNADFLS